MATGKPLLNICTYKVKPGKEAEMEKLLSRHWPTLRRAGLATDTPARIYRGLPDEEKGGRHGAERTYVEIFEWVDDKASGVAHQTPEIMAVWEPMGAICEDMQFPKFEPLELREA